MSQPKSQLETFKAWAGKDSDISYCESPGASSQLQVLPSLTPLISFHLLDLNSHHIDIHAWYLESLPQKYVPTRVTASGSTGVATSPPYNCVPGTEDTITLLVEWESSTDSFDRGIAVYTASWTAPTTSGVHSEQKFHYLAKAGEINIDQARRGYSMVLDGQGTTCINPFYMRLVSFFSHPTFWQRKVLI